MPDLRQTPQYAKHLRQIGWTVEKKGGIYYFIKRFPLVGSVMKIQRPESLIAKDIDLLCKKYRVFLTVIEPLPTFNEKWLEIHSYKSNGSPFLPSKTIQIDLSQPAGKLLAKMHPKTRYNIKIAKKKDLKVIKSRDIGQFADFWQKCARSRHKLPLPQKKEIKSISNAFGSGSDIFVATYDGKLVAALLTIKAGKVTYYMYAASNSSGKKLYAPTALTWEAILSAKSRGVKVFDFEGIFDERFPIKTWKGFTRFKKGFGGYEVNYPGAFVKYRLPVRIG